MKKLITAIALAGSIACFAQEPVKKASRGERMNPEQRREMMRQRKISRMGANTMRGRAVSFGKLADGRETKVYRLRGLGGLILDVDGAETTRVVVGETALGGRGRAE